MLTSLQIAQFQRDGFLILRTRVAQHLCAQLHAVVRQQLETAAAPLEYEADLGYTGAPASRDAPGGGTIRRLRGAYHRDTLLQQWAADPDLIATLGQLLTPPVALNLAHHNCVMTKHPDFGTATGWHRDIRYWKFNNDNLITVWLALGNEDADNGGLQVIPGSHRWQIGPDQKDALDFLRADLPRNQPLIDQGIVLSLAAGDVLLFHSSLYHAAGKNRSGVRKLSVAFAYHGADTAPLPGSPSAAAGEIIFS